MSANTICKKTSSYQIVRLYLCSLKVTFLPFFVVLFCFVLRMALTFFKLLALNEERTKLHSLQVWPRRWLFLTNTIGFSVFLRFLKHVHVAWSGNSRYLRDAHVRKPPQMLKNHSAWRKTNTHTHTHKKWMHYVFTDIKEHCLLLATCSFFALRLFLFHTF